MTQFQWSFFPAKKHKIKTGFTLFFIGFILSVIYFYFGLYWVFFAVVIFFVMLYSYFIPTRYKIDKDGVEVKKLGNVVKYEWSKFRRIRKSEKGFLLSTLSRNSWLDKFRGVFLYVPSDYAHKEEMLKFVEKQIKKIKEVSR